MFSLFSGRRPTAAALTNPLAGPIATLILGLAVLPITAGAQGDDTSDLLPEVVVTADASAESLTVQTAEEARLELSLAPGGTAVVESDVFQRGRASTVKDALDFAPGVFVQPRFGAEESRLSIRGSGLQRTFHGRGLKFLQDGVPLNLADGGFDFQAVEPLATSHIEVYRGANALEFGSTTLGGAVNFISHTGHTAPRLGLRLSYGSFDTWHGQVSSGGVFGPTDYYLSLSHFSQDGFREHAQQNTQRLFANVGYRLSPEWETRFYITYVQTDSELPGSITKDQLERNPRQAARVPRTLRGVQSVARFDNVTSNWKRDFELFRIANDTTYQSGDHRFSISSFWSHKDLDHPILFVIDQLSNDFGLNLRYDNAAELFGHRNHFTMGFSPTYGMLEDNRFLNVFGNRGAKISDNEQTALNLEFYLQDRFYLLPQLAIVAGGQITYAARESVDHFPTSAVDPDNSDRQDWWGYSPKLGLLWEIAEDVQAFANVSRSFEPPSFGELTNAANGGAGLVKLEAQTATTVEVGTRGRKGRVAWDLAYYHAWLDDELLGYEIAPGLTQTINAGRTIHQGVEAALEVDLFRGVFARTETSGEKNPVEARADRVFLRQIYLWNDFRFDGDPVFGDNRLPGIPQHYFRAELMYEHPCGFYIGPNVEWVPQKYSVDLADSLHADPYALLGVKVGYRTERGFSVFFEAKNLTDERYASTTNVIVDARGADSAEFFPGDGRSFYGGIEWKW